MRISTDMLAATLPRFDAHMQQCADELNQLDGKLGDGDLGITMSRGSAAAASALPFSEDDFGRALLSIARAFTATSASSFGTLFATGLMAAAKRTSGRSEIDAGELPALIHEALAAMTLRGKASLGQKTVLDGLEAIRVALMASENSPDPRLVAEQAVAQSIEEFRLKPAQVGRARIHADASVGLPDPGMVALLRAVEALGSKADAAHDR